MERWPLVKCQAQKESSFFFFPTSFQTKGACSWHLLRSYNFLFFKTQSVSKLNISLFLVSAKYIWIKFKVLERSCHRNTQLSKRAIRCLLRGRIITEIYSVSVCSWGCRQCIKDSQPTHTGQIHKWNKHFTEGAMNPVCVCVCVYRGWSHVSWTLWYSWNAAIIKRFIQNTILQQSGHCTQFWTVFCDFFSNEAVSTRSSTYKNSFIFTSRVDSS